MERTTIQERASVVTNHDRRRFLERAIHWLGGTMAALLGVPSAVYVFALRRRDTESRWMDAGDTSELGNDFPQEITFRRNRIDGWKIHSGNETAWLSKTADGKLIAFSPWCTHLGCAYRWEPNRNEFSCPCHGSRFAKEGGVIAGPATRPLDRYEVKLEGKRIWLSSQQSARG
ncbi:MAG TPA: ubiquinol-cytochrome c reductase iron-sulfur subunit [Chthoniobacterales bacterium]|nr:ubiquinol-cytochrome c reductase iron-sulfur subunit [Chthoniobacterales bacterium]